MKADKNRIQVDLSNEQMAMLEELMQETGISTKKDLVLNAVTLLNWAARETRDGRVIAAVDPEREAYREILLPALVALKRTSAKVASVEAVPVG